MFRPGRLKPRGQRCLMSDGPANNGTGNAELSFADIDAATRRLMTALDALEGAVERRREADRDENELAVRIHALGADRSPLAPELGGSLVNTRRLARNNPATSAISKRSSTRYEMFASRQPIVPGPPRPQSPTR